MLMMPSITSSPVHFCFFLVVFLSFQSISVASQTEKSYRNDVSSDYDYHGDFQALLVQSVKGMALEQSSATMPHPTIFTSIKIDYHDQERAEKTDMLLNSLIEPQNNVLRSAVREISVDGGYSYGNWALVDRVFLSLRNLEAVYWHSDHPISLSIRESLEAFNPSARLHYYTWFYGTNYQDHDGEKQKAGDRHSIVNSKNLYAFVGNINYGWKINRQDDLGLAWLVLKTCPNVRELVLTIGWSGCEAGAGQPYSFDFSSDPGTRLAPLEVLKLNGYDLESTNNAEWVRVIEYDRYLDDETDGDEWEELRKSFRAVEIEKESRKAHRMNIEEWLDAMDWTRLHTLHLNGASPKVLQRLFGSTLPSLKHLCLAGAYEDHAKKSAIAHEKFLNSTILPLESIALQDARELNLDSLLKIIGAHHGSALKHFTITGTLTKLTEPQISDLLTAAPQLKTLDIDMARPAVIDTNMISTPQWDVPLLSSLRSHPSLQHLILRFPSSDKDPAEHWDANAYPRAKDYYGFKGRISGIEDELLNHTSVLELFTILRERVSSSGREGLGPREDTGEGITNVEVFVGDYDGRFQYGMFADPQCVLAHYTCFLTGDGSASANIKCEGEATQNAYYG